MMKPPQLCLLYADSGPGIAISSTPPAKSVVGTPYTFTPTVVSRNGGGTSPYTWSITAGTLPGWASFDSTTGAVTGTPTFTAEFLITMQVVDSLGLTAAGTFTFDQVLSDPDIASVVTLLHLDGTNGSTTFTDVIGKTWTSKPTSTGPSISTAQSQFGGASVFFDESDDYLNFDNTTSSDFNMGSGDFTIEAWVRPTTGGLGGDRGIFTVAGVGGVSFGLHGGAVFCGGNSVAYGPIGATTLTHDVWVHVAASKSGGNMRVYVNGVRDAILSDTETYTNGSSTNVTIGASIGSTPTVIQANFGGYIDEVRVTKGVARYTGTSFTVPAAAFPDV